MKVIMGLYDKDDLRDKLWSGAIDTINHLTNNEVKIVLDILEDAYKDNPLTLTQLNDFFWFEADTIAEWLGYESFEDL